MSEQEENKKEEAKEVDPVDLEIVFYCKDCNELVETSRVGKKYVYTCRKCGTKNVAFGTRRSIANYFKMDELNSKKNGVVEEKTTELKV